MIKSVDKVLFAKALEIPSVDENPIRLDITISVILEKNGAAEGAIKIQDELIKEIIFSDKIHKGLYRYPKNTLHFSAIALPNLSELNENQISFIDRRREPLIAIRRVLSQFEGYKIPDNKIEYAFIFPKKAQSLAVQAFPSADILDFFSRLKTELEEVKHLGEIVIKGNPSEKPERFAVNLVRFFECPDHRVYQLLKKRVNLINLRSFQNPLFRGKLKNISAVVSDNWLSNADPEVFSIKVK